MALAQKLLRQVVPMVEGDPLQPETAGRRAATRAECPLMAILLQEGNGEPAAVSLIDVSSGGVGFTHSKPLQVGEDFLIGLPRQSAPLLWLKCTASRCDPCFGDLHTIGARFVGVADAPPQFSGRATAAQSQADCSPALIRQAILR